MSLSSHLAHIATIERADHATDAYGQRVPQWKVVAEDVPCRLVQREISAPFGALAEQPVVIVTTILFAPDANVHETDQVTNVVFEDRTTDAGPFVIRTFVIRRTRRGIAHKTATVDRVGR